MSAPDPLIEASKLPNGARFYRCALQVNPYGYLKTTNRKTPFPDEDSYNTAIIDACKAQQIEVIAVTDHYRVKTGERLRSAARAAGLHVFPGFEAVTKEGVHVLCVFDSETDVATIERMIGACGIPDDTRVSPNGKLDVSELLEEAHRWKGLCIAAHVASDGGLLRSLTGQARINAWRSPRLLACSLPGPATNALQDVRNIILNIDPGYRREPPIAVINAQDVSDPADLAKPSTSCFIKMSVVSCEGLRQAFLEPRSRIRLVGEAEPEERTELVAVTWLGGFLDGAAIHLNEGLNVLVGGRGAGKSTVIESLRYVLGLEPVGEDARTIHQGVLQHVLKSGTKISLLVRSHRPSARTYRVERTVPSPPVVRDEQGQVLALTPSDVARGVEVYGQHEIAEVAKSPEKRTSLLQRFLSEDASLTKRKGELRRELERSRARVVDIHAELASIRERLGSLPNLEQTLKRFEEAGLEERLRDRSLLVQEDRVLKAAIQRLEPFAAAVEQLRRSLPIDRAFVSAKALEPLPGRSILEGLASVLETLDADAQGILAALDTAIQRAREGLTGVQGGWEQHKAGVQANYEKILRELQKAKVDGEEFIRLRHQVEELRPLKEREATFQRDLDANMAQRRNLVAEWEDAKTSEFQALQKAAKKVTKDLKMKVRVQVVFAGNRSPLETLLKNLIGGNLGKTLETLRQKKDFSVPAFAEACKVGADALIQQFGLTPGQAQKLAQLGPAGHMQLEELDLPPTTSIELNVASEGQTANWKAMEDLSAGQKATAVLLLLLLESEGPLVVDQPEDDLDNRFIMDSIVPKMLEEKRRRQFLFSTHNANVPVLGDAELIVGLTAAGESAARIPREHVGSIDAPSVRAMIEELLEGGREAFEMRRLKYGF